MTIGQAGAGRRGVSKTAFREKKDEPEIKRLREQLVEALACKVNMKSAGESRGKIEIYYESLDELDRILSRLNINH